jgi:hypothetical protein
MVSYDYLYSTLQEKVLAYFSLLFARLANNVLFGVLIFLYTFATEISLGLLV